MIRKLFIGLLVAVAALTPLRFASAEFVQISGSFSHPGGVRSVTAAESMPPSPAPVGGVVHRFYVTTDADILSIDQIRLYGVDGMPLTTLYNHIYGDVSNAEPGNPLLVPVFPAVAADSWITTPGFTFRVGPDLPGDGVTTSFADLTNDGPQSNFQFAQFTLPGDVLFGFQGQINIVSDFGPLTYPFHFPLMPEPSSLVMAGLAALGMVTVRRRCQ